MGLAAAEQACHVGLQVVSRLGSFGMKVSGS